MLGHPARVRLLQVLREGEQSVGALQDALELDSSGASQQLAALRKQGLVVSRKEGTSVYYRVKDPRTLELLELAKEIISATLEESQGAARRARRGGLRAAGLAASRGRARAGALAGGGLARRPARGARGRSAPAWQCRPRG